MTPEACILCKGTDFRRVTSGVRDWVYGVEGTWDLVACTSCGLVRLEPFPTIEDLHQAYDIDYHGYATP